MKSLSCKQMGGACDFEIKAETFEEAVEQSKAHGMQMMTDADHMQVMQKVMAMSKEEQQKLFDDAKALWEQAPEQQ